MSTKRTRLLGLAAVAVLVATIALGVAVRIEDPLQNPVVPAEDPYTHMALVRDHLSDGTLDPLYEGGTMYPPGFHAVVAATWVYTGTDLESLFLFGPVAFGAIGIIGIALLLARSDGAFAAIVGGLSLALAPEMIFRTNMMSPTALDMAIVPFFLYAVLEAMRGRIGWSIVVGAMSLFFVTSHPWLMAILAPVALGTAMVSFVLPQAKDRPQRLAIAGAGAVLLAIGGGLGLAVSLCWSQCGLGFQDISFGGTALDTLAGIIAFVCLGIGTLLLVFRRAMTRAHEALAHRKWPLAVRAGLSAVIVAALLAVTIPAVQNGMPEFVDLPRMFGWPMLALGGLALVALPFFPGRAATIGTAVVTVTYPFVIHNPLDSPFWPHRTAAYFGIGLVIMAGVGAAALLKTVRAVGHWIASRQSSRSTRPVVAGGIMTTALVLLLPGTVYAATPLEYEGGWYRLYSDCENEKLKELSGLADADTVVVTGSWQAKLVMAAYAPDPEHVWFDASFYHDPERRDELIYGLSRDGIDVHVIVDRHYRLEDPDPQTGFLQAAPFTDERGYCDEGLGQARLLAYRAEVTA